MCYYLDNFIVIFNVEEAIPVKMKAKALAYIWLTDLLGILKNDSKD